VIPVTLGPASDLFFLSFDQLGSHVHAYVEPTVVVSPPAPDNTPKPDFGVATFERINHSLARITVPEEWMRLHKEGHAHVVLDNLGPEVFGVVDGKPVPLPGATQLHEGPISAGAASSVREWGYGLRAFPHAGLKPGFISVRIYQGHVLDALLNAAKIWRGLDVEGMYDWFATEVRMRFSRPMPFQIGGDVVGERSRVRVRLTEPIRIVDFYAPPRG